MTGTLTSYCKGHTDTPLIDSTVGDFLDRIAARYPDNEALVSVHQGLRFSYREFLQRVEQCARALMAAGLARGDRIGIWSPNCAEWTILQFASSKVGAILVTINPSYRLHELEFALTQSGCSALVIAPEFRGSDYRQMILELAPELARSMPGALNARRLFDLKTVICIGVDTESGTWGWQDFMRLASQAGADELGHRQRQLSPQDAVNIQYTSGTTGTPKGATLSHFNILNNAWFGAQRMNFSDQDRLVIPVPLYHCFGMVTGNLLCVSHGATMILPSEAFEPGAVLRAIHEERATAVHGVPTMFIAELEHPDFQRYDFSSLRTGIMGGSPCPVEVMNACISRMNLTEMEIAYGMTETSPIATQTLHDAPVEKRVSTVGLVHPHVEIKIVDPGSGETVERGVPGEICTRGYNVMLGYWKDGEQTAQAIDAGGWMHTGDLATMDADGYVSIVGRIKDMIIRGGENVYPREIEEFLHTHPKVLDVQVIGVPDSRLGEEIMAWVILREGELATSEELKDFCQGRIAHFKVPRHIKFVNSFPLTVTGKVQKFVMREQSIVELGLRNR